MARIGLRLAVPSFLIALIWQIGVGQISMPELGFFSNWLYTSRVALFPIWFAQAFSQLLIAMALMFYVTGIGERIARRPLAWVSGLYALTASMAFISYLTWDTAYLADKLPHLVAWNFAFGWLIWAVRDRMPGPAGRITLTIVLAASVALLFVTVDADNGASRAMVLPLIVLPVIWFDRIALPPLLARMTIVAGQATLFIFLFHYYAFWAVWRVGRLVGLEAESQNPLLRMVVGLLGPVLLWALWTAMLRVYRRDYGLSSPGARQRSKAASASGVSRRPHIGRLNWVR
jgi:hypothetical protein